MPNTVRSDTTGATAFATGEKWFEEHVPIYFDGRRYLEYGLPRPLPAEQMAAVGSLGNVRIYKEAGARDSEALCVPTGPDAWFVSYITYENFPCNR